MKNKYMVSINGIQQYDNDDNTDVVFTTEADFENDNGIYYVDYEESEITGLEGSKTSIEIGSDYVSLTRDGAMSTQMLFMIGRKTNTYYNTPYGNMLIGIYTESLTIDVNANGGKVVVEYYLDVNNQTTSKNKFEIDIFQQKIDE